MHGAQGVLVLLWLLLAGVMLQLILSAAQEALLDGWMDALHTFGVVLCT